MEEFKVKIASDTGVFYPGQTVNATLALCLKEPTKAKAVRVHVIGKARVHWTEEDPYVFFSRYVR